MKIVSVMTSPARGGAEHAAVLLLDALAGRGHDVRLLCSDPGIVDGQRVTARRVELGPKLSKRTWPRLVALTPLLARRLAVELAREAPFDVLLLHFKKEQLLAPLLPPRLRPRLAWAEWGPVPFPLRSGVPGRLFRRAARDVAAVLAISEGTRQSLIAAGVPAGRVRYVPNVIDPDWARPRPEAGAAWRRTLGVPHDAFLVGCLTRYNIKKRNEVAIDAVALLAGEPGPEVHLLMMGEGETEGALRARAARLGDRVHFEPNPGQDAPQVLSGCDVVVFCPSPTEGEPRAILLGQLAGRPVVATAAEGAVDLIPPGAGAIASPDHDAGAVAALLAGYRGARSRADAEGRVVRDQVAARHRPDAVAALAERLLAAVPPAVE